MTYNTPRTDKVFFIEQFDSLFDRLSLQNTPVIVCGDINIDIMRDNLPTSKYLDVIISNGFIILNQEPTRIVEMAQTCPDHFIIKDVHHQILAFSDHIPVVTSFH